MSAQWNKAPYRRLIDELFNARAPDRAFDLVAPDFVGHWLFDAPDMQGQEGFRDWVAGVFAAFPDWHGEIEGMVADDEKVVARWHVQGTQQGDWITRGVTIPAQGKRMDIQGVHIARFVDDKLVELWHAQDRLLMLQQLGAMPSPAAAATTT